MIKSRLSIMLSALMASAAIAAPNWIKGEKHSSKRGSSQIGRGNKGGKYMPHQGKRECERRVRQADRNAEKAAKRHNAEVWVSSGYAELLG